MTVSYGMKVVEVSFSTRREGIAPAKAAVSEKPLRLMTRRSMRLRSSKSRCVFSSSASFLALNLHNRVLRHGRCCIGRAQPWAPSSSSQSVRVHGLRIVISCHNIYICTSLLDLDAEVLCELQ